MLNNSQYTKSNILNRRQPGKYLQNKSTVEVEADFWLICLCRRLWTGHAPHSMFSKGTLTSNLFQNGFSITVEAEEFPNGNVKLDILLTIDKGQVYIHLYSAVQSSGEVEIF